MRLSSREKESRIATLTRDNEKPDVINAFEKIAAGEKLHLSDVESLMGTNNLHLLGLFADKMREKVVGRTVTYIPNIILNYTNRCIVKCRFCAFYRELGSSEGYALTVDQAADRVIEAWTRLRIRQALIQGGVNPEYGVEYFEELFRAIKTRTNGEVAINGLSTSEIEYIAKKERMSVKELLSRLREAGIDSLPGAGAEILVDRVRRSVGRGLSTAEGWLRTMEEAHKLGIPTSATMVYGLGETAEERAQHLLLIRDLQERTGGFKSFTAWNFEQGNTRLGREGVITAAGPSAAEHLKITALARIVFGESLRNIQSSWLTNGVSLAQLSLCFGANDWGGTLYDEEVIPATGKNVGNLAPRIIVESVKQIRRPVAERDNSYNIVRYVG